MLLLTPCFLLFCLSSLCAPPVLSPPSKVSEFKKRVSPAKDIQHKRAKDSENRGSWKARPEHLEALGSSIGSTGSLGAGLSDGLHNPSSGLMPPHHALGMPTFGMIPEPLGMDTSLAALGAVDDMDHPHGAHGPFTSTPASTPNRAMRRGNVGSSGSAASTPASAVAGKKTSLDWSDDEIRLFEEGLVLFGAPNWRQVAALVGSKSTSQVKQFSVKYFALHGPNAVPDVNPMRLEGLRAQYLPHQPSSAFNGSHSNSSSQSSAPGSSLKQSSRLKRSSPTSNHGSSQSTHLHHPAGNKLVTPKKASGLSSSSGVMATSGKSASPSMMLSASTSSGIGSPNGQIPAKGPGNKGVKSGANSSSSGRRSKADEQLILLKKNAGDEDEDICIEDEEIDIDGDDDDEGFMSGPSKIGNSSSSRSSARNSSRKYHREDYDDGAEDEVEDYDDEEDESTARYADEDGMSQRSGSSGIDLQRGHLIAGFTGGKHTFGKSPAVAAPSQQQQWRQKPPMLLDQSADFIREDSISNFSDADSSVAGMDLSMSTSSLYDHSPMHNANASSPPMAGNSGSNSGYAASAASIAQALKALGLEGEAWIEDVEIPPPKVLELAEDHVLELEMQANSEFFEGNAVKTPERYVRIRNHIVRTWAMNKMRYITKTSVRRGLRDCGDVNAIGRVHQFLELVGAINFGLEAPPSCRKQGQPEPLSVLMMNKAPLQQHIQQQQMARSAAAAGLLMSPPRLSASYASPNASPMQPGAPSYASVVVSGSNNALMSPSGIPNAQPQIASSSPGSRPSIRSQFDPSFEIVKNSATHALPTLIVSSNIMMVVDLHAQIHKRDGFGLIAGTYEADTNTVLLKHAIPYTGPQSAAASSLQAVTAWEKSVASWLENSIISKQASASGAPLEILGYYTTHKLNGALSVTQFTHYRNVFCKGASKNRPFVGIFAVPFERTVDTTLFHAVMYPVAGTIVSSSQGSSQATTVQAGAPQPPGAPQKTLCLLKRHVYCERKLPQEQFAQIFSAYADNDVALNMGERDERDPHRTILDRCLVSLSSAVFVSERDKNALWEHMRVLASEGVSPKLLAMLSTKEAVWSFKEPSLSSGIPPVVNNMGIVPPFPSQGMGFMGSPSPMQQPPQQTMNNASVQLGFGAHPNVSSHASGTHNGPISVNPISNVASNASAHPQAQLYGSTAMKLDFSSLASANHDHLGSLGANHSSDGLLGPDHSEPRF